MLSYLFATCQSPPPLFIFTSVSFSSLLWQEGLSARASYPDRWTVFLSFRITLSVNTYIYPHSSLCIWKQLFWSTLLPAQISYLPVWNIIAKWDSGPRKQKTPGALYELSHKRCHRREPGGDFCIWVVFYIFLGQAAPDSACTWNTSSLRSTLSYTEFFFIDRNLQPHLWAYF